MKIALIGGVYGKSEVFRRKLQMTPETVLEEGLVGRGHQVATFSHYAQVDGRSFQIVHVHHLSYGSIRAATDDTSAAFVYTNHDLGAMTRKLDMRRRAAARFVMSRADAVVALSVPEADFQTRNYPLAGALRAIIPNGVEAKNYCYARHNLASKGAPWRLLYVGQLVPVKNVDVLLRAVARIERPVELQLVYHNAALEVPLRKLASELGLSERVSFMGSKSPGELAPIYQCADVFVLPSASEALPSVVTEAMLCGTPVVATDVGGVRDQLGGYGVCVPSGCPSVLAAAISRMLDQYSRFAEQGIAASAYARERFSIKNMVDRHLELYAALLEREGPRRRHSGLHQHFNTVLKMGVNLACIAK